MSLSYSIYLYIEGEEYLDECLSSIFLQNKEVIEKIKVYALDSVESEKTKGLVSDYKTYDAFIKEKLHYVPCKGKKAEEAYQEALDSNEGEYVSFIKDTTIFQQGTLSKVLKKAREMPDKAVALTTTYRNKKGTLREYLKFLMPRNEYINIKEKYVWYNPYLASYIFPSSLVKQVQPDVTLKYEGLMDYCIKLIDRAGGYYLMSETVMSKEDLEVDPYNYPCLFEKDWYTEHVREYIIPTLKSDASKFVQFAMLYSIGVKFAGNLNDRNKTILDLEEKEEFYEAVKEALKLMDDDVIFYNGDMEMKRVISRHMYYKFYALKYDGKPKEVEFKESEFGPAAMIDDNIVELVDNMDIKVSAINNKKDTLEIYAKLKNIYFMNYDNIQVYAQMKNEKVYAVRNEIYSLTKFFGQAVHKDYSFKIDIDKSLIKGNAKVAIMVAYGENTFRMPVRFSKPQAHLWGEFPGAYWRFDKQYLSYNDKKKEFVIQKRNIFMGIGKELKYWGSMLKHGEEFARSVKCIPLRLLYFITKPYYSRQNIWITYDQLFKGGDNGEYFYRYVSERKDKGNIVIYYIANKNSREYKELNAKYGTVLAFNSLKHKLVSLHADYVFATRVAFNVYLGYWQQTERYFRDMFNAEIFCLQHGLTIQKIAQYQNRLFDNTKLYFCVSPVEMDNLRHPIYGYEEKELILTGAPRYDGLVSQDKRYILISPTWRRNVTAGTNKKGNNHDYSPNFKHTEYFRIYNSLINDKKLIEYAKKYNYKLIYLIHPILSPQIKDFETNDYVEIIPGAGNVSYEKMLSEASLMLTDHSGVQFDFAYMRKPLVYYHPNSLPPQYEEGGIKYEINGFGPVCKEHEEIVETLCEYMQNNCVMKDEYVKRVESFFGFSDRNNCERIYEAALKYINEHENK